MWAKGLERSRRNQPSVGAPEHQKSLKLYQDKMKSGLTSWWFRKSQVELKDQNDKKNNSQGQHAVAWKIAWEKGKQLVFYLVIPLWSLKEWVSNWMDVQLLQGRGVTSYW